MFIGEAPGFHEDREGRPFVGAAGKYLDELLAAIGMKREQVYICNVIKCRPPQNRDPLPEEMEACRPYLERQIELVNPSVIVTISRFAMARWFPDKKISEIHGKPKRVGHRVIVPMYHPAAALHQPSLRRVLEEDFKRIPGILKELASLPEEEESKPVPIAQQMSLF
jgi:DNA polymerase